MADSNRPALQRHTPEYRNYLKSPDWQMKRMVVLSRANGACEHCKDSEDGLALEIHHIHYLSLGEENPDTDLIAVCSYCHEALDWYRRYIQAMETWMFKRYPHIANLVRTDYPFKWQSTKIEDAVEEFNEWYDKKGQFDFDHWEAARVEEYYDRDDIVDHTLRVIESEIMSILRQREPMGALSLRCLTSSVGYSIDGFDEFSVALTNLYQSRKIHRSEDGRFGIKERKSAA